MLLFTWTLLTMGQITIGSKKKPNEGALLDLKMNDSIGVNSSKGLGLPRVELKDIKTETDLAKTMGVTPGSLEHDEHMGLVVYNTGINTNSEETRFCPGVHIWDGSQWIPLTPYPDIQIKEGETISYKRSFEYLDPNDPNGWPTDKENARLSGYYQLGRIRDTDNTSPNGTEDIIDQRPGEAAPNTYTTSRFYVGYKIAEKKYKVKKSFSCNPNEVINWDNIPEQPEIHTLLTKNFEDGIWMTQNLRTTKLSDGTDIAERTKDNYGDNHTHIPQYFIPGTEIDTNPNAQITEDGGVLYNWSAAVAVGKEGGLPIFPSSHTGVDQGGETHPDIFYKGICPDGWHLPSNQEWTDLANGIARSVSNTTSTIFANQLSGAATNIPYGVNLSNSASSGVGGYLGQAMKTTTSVGNIASEGKSKDRSQSGFDAYLIGSSTIRSDGSAVGKYAYGEAAYFWTSSLNSRESEIDPNRVLVYHTSLKFDDTSFYQGSHNTFQTFSVRCKKNSSQNP